MTYQNTNSELIWVKLTTKGDKRLYIGACYRPDKSDEKTLNDCNNYLQAITKNENNVILLGGDSELDISPYRIKQHPRKINLYNKADWPGFKELTKNIGIDIKSTKNTCTIEELWITLKNGLLEGTNQFIP